MMRTLAALPLALLLGWALGSTAASEDRTFVTIGTGGFNGLYFRAGRRICKLVNSARAQTGLLCSVESTAGSIYNLNTIRAGGFEIGLAQSDWQYHAYQGTGPFEKAGPFTALRSLFSLYPEAFSVVARADAGIKRFRDLEGMRVNIGDPGSGHRATMEALMKALEWDMKDFALALELESDQQTEALCNNEIDAIIFTVGHPNKFVHDATAECDTIIVQVSGPAVDKLVAESPYYRHVTIPGGIYSNNPDDIKTFGVDATVVSSSAVAEETVYDVVRAVFENFDDFKQKRPVFANLSKAQMIKNGLSAPLHVGAIRYYKEVGLLK
jgi:uncharacterized protein